MATTAIGEIFHARTKTQKSLKANILRLTTPTGNHESMWQLAERDTAHARDALATWVATGAIEKITTHSGYSTNYRVTAAGLDEVARREARIAYLAECLAAIGEQEAVYGGALAEVHVEAGEFLGALTPINPEDSARVINDGQEPMIMRWHAMSRAWSSMRYAASIILEQRRMMEAEQERIDATGDDYDDLLDEARRRVGDIAPAADVNADPLGGDA